VTKFSLIILIIFLCICTYLGLAVSAKPLLQVAFLNVPKGDAILITSPEGNRVLIDGGPDKSVLPALGREMSFYEHSIDLVLATSQKSSDIGGLPFVFDRFNVGAFVNSGSISSATYRDIEDDITEKNIPEISVKIGDEIDIGDRTKFVILSSGAEITGKIIYGETEISFPADIPAFASSTNDIVFESDGVNIWKK